MLENVSVKMIKRMIQAEKDKHNNYDEIPIPQSDGSIIVYRF